MAAQVIHPEEATLVVEALLAERVMGYSRRLSDTGEWLWRHPNATSATPWKSEPPLLLRSPEGLLVLMSMLTRVGDERGLLWSIQRLPVRARRPPTETYTVSLVQPGPDQRAEVVAAARADDLQGAIGTALLRLLGHDIEAAHRQLFPERYIVANDGEYGIRDD